MPDPPPASPAGYPTPDQAFALMPPIHDADPDWENPAHGDKVVPLRHGFALLSSGSRNTCVGCEPALSVAYFRKARSGWRLAGRWNNIYRDGYKGQFGEMELIDIGQPNPTVAVHGGYFNEGCDVDAMGLIELAPAGPILRVDRAPLRSGNGEQTSDPALRIDVEAEIGRLKGRPGFEIHYTGAFERQTPIDTRVIYTGPGLRWHPHPGIFKHDCANWWRFSASQ